MLDDREFGDALVAIGFLTPEEVQEALREREALARTGSFAPFLWDILIRKGCLTRVQVDEVLAGLQNRRRFCAACNAGVLAPRITPAGERCGRCDGPVNWRFVPKENAGEWGSATVTLMEDAPPHVREAGRDPSCILGKYVLVEEAGRGGAGVVYKTWDLMLGQYVALKLIRRDAEGDVRQDEQIKDLVREARNAIRLRHPNIVPVIDAGRIGREFYICMEYIEGGSLATRIEDAQAGGRLSPFYVDPLRTLEIMRDTALGIHYAHTFPKPIVHCDLKPANVLLDGQDKPYIADFGLALAVMAAQDDIVDEHFVRGTPAYMAPEQMVGGKKEIGPWTDTYALGATLYVLLAGRTMFEGNDFNLMFQTVNEEPVPPLEVAARSGNAIAANLAPRISRETRLESLCLKCLAKKPADRPATARHVALELDAALYELRRSPEPLPAAPGRQDAPGSEVLSADPGRQPTLMEASLKRAIDRINRLQPKVARIELCDRVLEGVEILHATDRIMVVFHDGQSVEVPWSSLRPDQFMRLADELLKTHDPRMHPTTRKYVGR